jgi:hypothetical protein
VKASKSDQPCQCGCAGFTYSAAKTDARRGHVKGKPMAFLPSHGSNNGKFRESGAIAAPVDPASVELDELKIRASRSLDEGSAAYLLDARLRFLESQYKRTFVERGFILVEMEERKLWKLLTNSATGQPYDSFDRWVVSAASHSRSDCFEAMRAVKELRDIPKGQLMEIPRKNIMVLQSLSSQVRKQPETIAAAQTASKREFILHIQTQHPDQHLEQEIKQTTYPTESQRKVIDRAREIACWAYGSADREGQDEAICQFFLEGSCEREGFTEYSNRTAYETAVARGEVA